MTAPLFLLAPPRSYTSLVNAMLERHTEAGGAAMVTSHGTVSFHGGEPRRIRMHD